MKIEQLIPLILTVYQVGRTALLAYNDIRALFAEFEGLPPTPENIEALRLKLLQQASIQSALDNPVIRDLLQRDGVDPDSLRIPG